MTYQQDNRNSGPDYAIHVDGGGTHLPPHPGPAWTRFVCISDTHSREYRVPSGDVLLHGGDLSSWGHPRQLEATIEWLKTLGHPVKIIVAGNHDLCLDRTWAEDFGTFKPNDIEQMQAYVRGQSSFGLYYLEHEPLHVTTPTGRVWKVYGSPTSPRYAHGSFQYEYDPVTEAQEIYSKMPDDTDILITHTPPFGVLDKTKRGINAGCQVLLARLNHLKDCRLHVFGHIHEAAGVCVNKASDTDSARVSVNAAMLRSESAIVVDLRN